MGKWLRRLVPLLAIVGLIAGCANRPTDGHPLQHLPGQWPNVVVEDHTSSYFPVNGSFGAGWGIQGAIRGLCSTHTDRICYKFFEGNPGNNGAFTSWYYHSGGPFNGQKYVCTTTINPINRTQSFAIRQQLVRHEIGHCYGMAHGPQGTGTMEPKITGKFPNPTQDERDTLQSLYVG